MIKKMGYQWHLRRLMAGKELWQTTDLVPLLAERGITLSREQTRLGKRHEQNSLRSEIHTLSATAEEGIGISTTLAPCRRSPPELPSPWRLGLPRCSYRPVAAHLLAITLIPRAPMTSLL